MIRMDSLRKTQCDDARGFTMIEFAVAIAIVAAVAAFAVPSYRRHVDDGQRLKAVTALFRAAQYVETLEGRYPAALPGDLSRIPNVGAEVYALTLRTDANARGGYAIEASPVDGGAMQGDACGTYVLHADGTRENRTVQALDPSTAARACWLAR